MVVGWHGTEIGLGDLDEVAEDRVVFDLEALDASALDLAVLQVGDPLTAQRGATAQFIERLIVTHTEDASFFDLHGRLINNGTLNFGGDAAEVSHAIGNDMDEVAVNLAEQRLDAGHHFQRRGESVKITSIATALAEAAAGAF